MIFGALVLNDDISRWFFHFCEFFIFRAVRGLKEQKMAQDDKKFSLLHFISQEPYIIWLSFIVHLCKMMISTSFFFIFSKFWFSGLLGGGGVKGQKIVQNEKKFCLSCSISQDSYIIWFSFMVLMFKMIRPPGVFFHIFKILIFWVVMGVKGQRIARNGKKFCLSCSISQEPNIWSSFAVHKCKIIISPGFCFIFSKF